MALPELQAGPTSASKPLPLGQAIEALAASKGRVDPNELASRMASVILEHAVREGVSDIHFDPVSGERVQVRFRMDGQLHDMAGYSGTSFPVTARLRVMAGFAPRAASAFTPEDGRFEISFEGRLIQFRVSAFPNIRGDKLVLRVLDMGKNDFSLKSLGFSGDVLSALETLIRFPSGMFVVAGLTGSGKTTTLSSILAALAREEVNIMTLEDPVEYVLPRVIHSQINPKAGFTFAEGLRSILRQDPNIIMVGEVRDAETAETALRAAMTGHMIFSTVHATTAPGVVHRFIGMGIEPYMISSAFLAALAQRLVRKLCPQCARSEPLDSETSQALLRRIEPGQRDLVRAALERPEGKLLKAQGCPACNNTGYNGRIGVFELLPIADPIRTLIAKKADLPELRKAGVASGMKTMLVDAAEKAWQGATSLEEIARLVTEV